MLEGPVRHLVTIGVPSSDIPNVGESVELVTECLAARRYQAALPELANLQAADVPTLKLKLSQWAQSVHHEDIAILYFAGHGLTVKDRHYLGLPGTDWSWPDATALASEDLFRCLAAGPNLINLLVILDACYSGKVAFDTQRLAGVLQGDDKERAFWLLTASHKKQPASDGGFAAAFHKRVLEPRGAALPRYELSTLVNDLNTDLPPYQTAAYAPIGLMIGEPPDFLPNPDFKSTDLLGHPVEDRQLFGNDLAEHWLPRAMGSEAIFQSGQWYFTGRTAALNRVVAWLQAPTGDGKGMVITGDPGCGKSALLAYLAVASDLDLAKQAVVHFLSTMPPGTRPAPGSITFALVLRGKTVAGVKAALGERFDSKPEDALRALVNRTEPAAILFDALDESAEAEDIADQVLRPLTGYRHLKILAGTRRPQIKSLGEKFNVLDLDLPGYRSDADIAQYAQRLLLAEGETRVTPYRGHADVAQPVAAAIAAQANGNYLVARTIARSLMERDTAIDLKTEQLPRSFPEAFAGYLKALAKRSGMGELSLRAALIPLAYSQGQGLPLDVWQRLSETNVTDALTAAAAFIGEYAEEGRTVYRLYHQALADALRDPKLDAERQRRMAQALYDAIPGADWLRADWYTRKYFSLYAAAGAPPLLEQALLDARFLASANVPVLLSVSRGIESPESKRRLNWLKIASSRLNNNPGDRLSNLALVALQNHAPDLAAICGEIAQRRSWQPKWARWISSVTPHRVLASGGTGEITSVAASLGIAVAGSEDHTVRFWNIDTGQLIGEPGRHENKVTSVAIDAATAISGGWDDTVRVWDAATAKPKGAPLTGHKGRVLAVAISGRLAASGDSSGDLFLWDAENLSGIAGPIHVSGGRITALAIADGFVAVGTEAGLVRFYTGTGDRAGDPALTSLTGPGGAVTAIAIGGGILAAVYGHVLLQRWKFPACIAIGEPLPLDIFVNAIAVGNGIAVLGCGDFKLRLIDVETGELKSSPFTGHSLFVRGVALDGNLIISGAADGTVRVWDAAGSEPIGVSEDGIERMASIASTGDIAITASYAQHIQLWSLSEGASKTFSETCFSAGGSGTLVAAGDGLIAFNRDYRKIARMDAKTGAVATFLGDYRLARALAIAHGSLFAIDVDSTFRRWDLATLQPIDEPFRLDQSANSLAIAADGSFWTAGGKLQRWDPATAAKVHECPEFEGISSLAIYGNLLAAGHWDGRVTVRDASNGQTLRVSTASRQTRVNCVAFHKNLVISGSPAGNLMVRDTATLTPLFEIQIGSPVNDLTGTPDGVCVACAEGIASLELTL